MQVVKEPLPGFGAADLPPARSNAKFDEVMDILGHGIDLIECQRVEQVWRQHADRFLGRILTPAERAYCERMKNSLPHIAGRFAAKEAVMKVLGTGWRGQVAWTDIEILNDSAGQPHVTLKGYCQEVARKLGISRILISITHTEHYAAASAIALGTPKPASY